MTELFIHASSEENELCERVKYPALLGRTNYSDSSAEIYCTIFSFEISKVIFNKVSAPTYALSLKIL